VKNKTAKTLKTNRTKQEKCSEKTKDIFERFLLNELGSILGKTKLNSRTWIVTLLARKCACLVVRSVV
jgi:hypothetical protein